MYWQVIAIRLALLYYQLPLRFGKKRFDKPVVFKVGHKCGTALWMGVLRKVTKHLKLQFQAGLPATIRGRTEVMLDLTEYIDELEAIQTSKIVLMLRDPREILISSYLYHKRGNESLIQPPMGAFKGGNYQRFLKSIDMETGLIHELYRRGPVFEMLLHFSAARPDCLVVRFEDLMTNYVDTVRKIFSFLDLTEVEVDACVEIARKFDVGQWSEDEIQASPSVTSRFTRRWDQFATERVKEIFAREFPGLVARLGYEE